MHRSLEILNAMLPHIRERAGSLSLHLVAHDRRDSDASDRRKCLQPRRDIHPVAIDVVAVDDDIAQIDADAVANALVFGLVGFAPRRFILDGECTSDRLDHTRKLRKDAVADKFENTAAMRLHLGFEDRGAIAHEARQRAGLVGLHQPTVAGHVGRQDRGQFALHPGQPPTHRLSLRSDEVQPPGIGIFF
jgi:hypothetical protein